MGDYITIKKEIMAININSVYKSVLSILNKEQRGYITPDEFNKIGKQVQLSLLDQAFTQYNKNINLQNSHLTNDGYADLPKQIEEKIDNFYKEETISLNSDGVGAIASLDIYKIINLSTSNTDIEQVSRNALPFLLSSTLSTPTVDFPIYYKSSATAITVNPTTTASPTLKYIKVPTDPRWGYSIDATYGTNIHDSRVFVDTGLIINKTLTLPANVPSASPNGFTSGALAITSTSGIGTGGTIKLTSASGNINTATVVVAGSGYAIGDTITISDSVMEGDPNITATGADLVITLVADNLYSSTTYGSTNFELHPSEEVDLILSILGYAGLTIKDAAITQLTTQIANAQEIVKQQ